MSIYQALKAAGVPTDNHESDLYAKATPVALQIARGYGYDARTFLSELDGQLWIEFPFRFDPFWADRAAPQMV